MTTLGASEDRPSASRWRLAAALALVLAVSAGVRLWLIAHTEVIARDGTIFVLMARGWSDEGMVGFRGYTFHPGYPVAIAGVHRMLAGVTGRTDLASWDLSGQIVSLLLGLAATAGVWYFAGKVFNWQVAWMAALLFGVGRGWASLGSDALSDAPAIAFEIWSIVLALAAMDQLARGSPRMILPAAAAGVLAGVGYLVRPEALLVTVPAAALWVACRIRTRKNWSLTFGGIGAMAAGALACAAPYMIAIGGLTRKKSLEDFVTLPARLGDPSRPLAVPWPDAVASPAAGGTMMLADAAGLPWAYAEGLGKMAVNLFAAMHPVVAALAVVWLVTWIGDRALRLKALREVALRPRAAGVFLMVGCLAVLGPFLIGQYAKHGFMSHRYLMLPAALLSSLAGAGVWVLAVHAAKAFSRQPSQKPPLQGEPLARQARRGLTAAAARPRKTWFLAAGLTVAVTAGLVVHSLRPLHEGKLTFRLAGQTLGSMLRPGDFVLSDDSWVLHYSGAEGRLMDPAVVQPEVLARLVRDAPATGSIYLVLNEMKAGETAPDREWLRHDPAFVPLETLRDSAPKKETVVFSVYRARRSTLP